MPITALPTPPTRTDSVSFAARADAFVAALPNFVSEANALQVDVAARQASVAANAASATAARTGAEGARDIALAASAYKGLWSSLSGALAIPAAVYHLGEFWVLTQSVLDVAATVPGTAPEWARPSPVRRLAIMSAAAAALEPASSGESLVDGTANTGLGGTLNGIVFGADLFVAWGNTAAASVASSADGLTWTLRSMPSSQSWRIGSRGAEFLAVGGTAVAVSANGVTWTAATALPGAAARPPVYVGGLWIVPGSGSTYYTSPDGGTWTTRTAPATISSDIFVVAGVAWYYSGTTTARTSADGINWTLRSLPFAPSTINDDFDGSIVIHAASETYRRTTDGVGWTDLGHTSIDGSTQRLLTVNDVRFHCGATLGQAASYHGTTGWVLRTAPVTCQSSARVARNAAGSIFVAPAGAMVARWAPASSPRTALFGY